jgi:hypothetical protein
LYFSHVFKGRFTGYKTRSIHGFCKILLISRTAPSTGEAAWDDSSRESTSGAGGRHKKPGSWMITCFCSLQHFLTWFRKLSKFCASKLPKFC